jgi:hypothetical protein
MDRPIDGQNLLQFRDETGAVWRSIRLPHSEGQDQEGDGTPEVWTIAWYIDDDGKLQSLGISQGPEPFANHIAEPLITYAAGWSRDGCCLNQVREGCSRRMDTS